MAELYITHKFKYTKGYPFHDNKDVTPSYEVKFALTRVLGSDIIGADDFISLDEMIKFLIGVGAKKVHLKRHPNVKETENDEAYVWINRGIDPGSETAEKLKQAGIGRY